MWTKRSLGVFDNFLEQMKVFCVIPKTSLHFENLSSVQAFIVEQQNYKSKFLIVYTFLCKKAVRKTLPLLTLVFTLDDAPLTFWLGFLVSHEAATLPRS